MKGLLNCTSPSLKRMILYVIHTSYVLMFQYKCHILKHNTVFWFRENSKGHLLFVYTELSVHYQNEERNLKMSYKIIPFQKTFNVPRFYHFIIPISFVPSSSLQLNPHSLPPRSVTCPAFWFM